MDRLSRHRALGGRPWIGLVAFALIGIVTLQLGLLKLNAGIGRALEHEAVLQRENAALSIENSELATSDRVTSMALQLGMEPVPAGGPGALRFLQARPRIDVAMGAAALSGSSHSLTSGERPAGGSSSSGAAEQPTTASAPASASGSGESSTATSSSATGPAESSTAQATAASPPGESSRSTSGEPTREPAESTKPAATAPSAGAEAGSSSPEGGPAGGTRAGPSG